MRSQLAKVAKLDHLDRAVLIKLMVLEYIDAARFKDVYEWHRKSPDGVGEPFAKLEGDSASGPPEELKPWQTAQLARWVRAEPALTHVDLRDYFWLSRSALDHTFAGVQMLSPVARQCIQQVMLGDVASRKAADTLYHTLPEQERLQIASTLSRTIVRDPDKAEAAQGLFEFAINGSSEAADALMRGLNQANPDRLNIIITHGLAALKPGSGKNSIDRLIATREGIAKKGKFGTALTRALNKK